MFSRDDAPDCDQLGEFFKTDFGGSSRSVLLGEQESEWSPRRTGEPLESGLTVK